MFPAASFPRILISGSGNRFFIFNSNTNGSLQSYSFSLTTPRTNTTYWGSLDVTKTRLVSTYTGGSSLAVALHPNGKVVYLSDYSGSQLRAIDVSQPTNPQLKTALTMGKKTTSSIDI